MRASSVRRIGHAAREDVSVGVDEIELVVVGATQPSCRSYCLRPAARLYIAVSANYAKPHAARPASVGTHQSQRAEAKKKDGDERGRHRKKLPSRGRVTWQRR